MSEQPDMESTFDKSPAELQQIQRTRRFDRMVPKRFRYATIDALTSEQHQDEIQQWINYGPGTNLVLVGGVGTGKTHAGWATLRMFMERGYKVAGATMFDLLESMRPGANGVERNELMEAEVALFDDLGVERQTEWAVEQFAGLIDRRTRQQQPSIVTSNATAQQIRDHYGDRTYSRLMGGATVLVFSGADQRMERW